MTPEERNQKLIGAVLEKADRVCPGALELVGVYGSFLTGDFHDRSDLDLLLVGGKEAAPLARCFVQEDLGVGHDLYITTWEQLQADARYDHPHVAKLMDARIVWCADAATLGKLDALRDSLRTWLSLPFSRFDLDKARRPLQEAEKAFTEAMLSPALPEMRRHAGGAVHFSAEAVAMLNKRYFRFGTRRLCRELMEMPRRPEKLDVLLEAVAAAPTAEALRGSLTALLLALRQTFAEAALPFAEEKAPPTPQALTGTWEEMVSNWLNKLYKAAETGDALSALLALSSMDSMLRDIGERTAIGGYEPLTCYDPADLHATARAAEILLCRYLAEYKKAEIAPARYPDIPAFLADYEND